MRSGAGLRCADRRDRIDGFALLEVMLALMLVALLAGLALPGLARATGPAALRIAAFQVSALLREERNLAKGAGHDTVAAIAIGGRSVLSRASSAVVEMPPGATVYLADAAGGAIRFSPNGRSSGGTLVIASATARCLVAVNPDTGAIRVGAP